MGRHGPAKLYYKDHRLINEVTLNKGIQHWTVPETGIWMLEARGASGADGLLKGGTRLYGGKGAQISGKFMLKKGDKLKILIGQEGTRDILDPRRPGGGGGGTFVVKSNGEPLLIAGGGGGGGIPPPAGDEKLSWFLFVCVFVVFVFDAYFRTDFDFFYLLSQRSKQKAKEQDLMTTEPNTTMRVVRKAKEVNCTIQTLPN